MLLLGCLAAEDLRAAFDEKINLSSDDCQKVQKLIDPRPKKRLQSVKPMYCVLFNLFCLCKSTERGRQRYIYIYIYICVVPPVYLIETRTVHMKFSACRFPSEFSHPMF